MDISAVIISLFNACFVFHTSLQPQTTLINYVLLSNIQEA